MRQFLCYSIVIIIIIAVSVSNSVSNNNNINYSNRLACVWVSIYVNHINVNVALLLTPEDYTAYLAVEVLADNSVIVY